MHSSSPASGSDPALSPVGHSIFACIPPKMRHSLPVQLDHFLIRSLPPGISFLQHMGSPKRVLKEPIAPLSPWQPFRVFSLPVPRSWLHQLSCQPPSPLTDLNITWEGRGLSHPAGHILLLSSSPCRPPYQA